MLSLSPVFAGEVLWQHGRARHDGIHSCGKGFCEHGRGDGSGVHRETGIPAREGLPWEEERVTDVKPVEAMGRDGLCVGVDVCPCV